MYSEYAISQLRIVRSGLHLVTYLDVGYFCSKSTETTLHEICAQVFLRFSDSSKPGQSVSLIYKLAGLAVIRKSEDNLLKIPCKVAPVTKVARIVWWRHDNRKQSASAREHWCEVSWDIPYCSRETSFFCLVYKLRRIKDTPNFILSGSKIVKRLWRRQYDPVIIERTIGLVLGPSTALCEPFLKHCTLTNKAVGTIWRTLSKPPQRRQGPDLCPLWLLVGTPSAIRPELAFSRAEHSRPNLDVAKYIFDI